MTRSPIHGMRSRAFGKGRPFVAPAVRRRKAANRRAAIVMGALGALCVALAYRALGMEGPPATPEAPAFVALIFAIFGFGLLACGCIAATEA
jgi:hypothetical protein